MLRGRWDPGTEGAGIRISCGHKRLGIASAGIEIVMTGAQAPSPAYAP